MKRKILKGVIVSNIVLVISTILSFLINKYFILYIGIESMGVVKLFNQLLGILSLAELGIGVSISYALYKPLVENDRERVKEVFYTMKYFYKKIIFTICILGILITFLLPVFMKTEVNFIYIVCWIASVLNTAFTYIFAVNVTLYNAEKKYNFVKSVMGISLIVGQILKIISIFLYQSFFVFILLNFVPTIINIFVFNRYFNKNYLYLKDSKKYKLDYTIFKDAKNVFVHNVAFFLGYQIDIILISMFCGLKTLAIYSSYIMVLGIWNKVASNVFSIISPHIGHYIVKNDKQDIYLKYKSMNIALLFFLIIIFVTTYYLIQPFMNMWINYTLVENSFVFYICFRCYLDNFRYVIQTFKVSAGFFNDVHLPIIEGILNFIISLILVRMYGVVGVVIGTIIPSILITFIWKPILIYKVVFDKHYTVYIKDFISYLLYSILTLLVIYFTFKYISIDIKTFIDFIFEGLKVFGIVSIITLFVFFLDKNFRSILFKAIVKIKPNN